MKAANSWDTSNRVSPKKGTADLTEAGRLQVRVPAPGLAVVRAKPAR